MRQRVAVKQRLFARLYEQFQTPLEVIGSEIPFSHSRDVGETATIRSRGANPQPQAVEKAGRVQSRMGASFRPVNPYRVFCAVRGEEITVLAFGEKQRNRLFIEGEEVEP